MAIHTIASRDFARDVGRAKRLTAEGPVLITDRGRPAFALLRIEDYYRMTGKVDVSIADLLAMPGDDIDFDPPRIDLRLRTPDFD